MGLSKDRFLFSQNLRLFYLIEILTLERGVKNVINRLILLRKWRLSIRYPIYTWLFLTTIPLFLAILFLIEGLIGIKIAYTSLVLIRHLSLRPYLSWFIGFYAEILLGENVDTTGKLLIFSTVDVWILPCSSITLDYRIENEEDLWLKASKNPTITLMSSFSED
jgi:hypothetical protein